MQICFEMFATLPKGSSIDNDQEWGKGLSILLTLLKLYLC